MNLLNHKLFQWFFRFLIAIPLIFFLLIVYVVFDAAYGPTGPVDPYVTVPKQPEKYIIAESGTFGFDEPHAAVDVYLIEPTGWFEEPKKEKITRIGTTDYHPNSDLSLQWTNRNILELKIKKECTYKIYINTKHHTRICP